MDTYDIHLQARISALEFLAKGFLGQIALDKAGHLDPRDFLDIEMNEVIKSWQNVAPPKSPEEEAMHKETIEMVRKIFQGARDRLDFSLGT